MTSSWLLIAVSKPHMRMRWALTLPAIGLLLFAFVSYSSLRLNRHTLRASSRYFWWSSIRLDSDPLNKHVKAPTKMPCENGNDSCIGWDSVYNIWVEPGWIDKSLTFSAFPAFIIGAAVVHGAGRLGISEVISFMISMPVLIVAWYCFVGWLIDRWVLGRRRVLNASA
jgi:hypothetical protein